MAFGRILLAWAAVMVWLVGWRYTERGSARKDRLVPRRELSELAGEAVLVTLFGALWFASLGAGAWWLPFLLVGLLREWPLRSIRGALRAFRLAVTGGILALVLSS